MESHQREKVLRDGYHTDPNYGVGSSIRNRDTIKETSRGMHSLLAGYCHCITRCSCKIAAHLLAHHSLELDRAQLPTRVAQKAVLHVRAY